MLLRKPEKEEQTKFKAKEEEKNDKNRKKHQTSSWRKKISGIFIFGTVWANKWLTEHDLIFHFSPILAPFRDIHNECKAIRLNGSWKTTKVLLAFFLLLRICLPLNMCHLHFRLKHICLKALDKWFMIEVYLRQFPCIRSEK